MYNNNRFSRAAEVAGERGIVPRHRHEEGIAMNRNINRRDFLKGTAAGALGLALSLIHI